MPKIRNFLFIFKIHYLLINFSEKIVGGNPTNITDVPYLVSFEQNEIFQCKYNEFKSSEIFSSLVLKMFYSGAHVCGGSIVSKNAIVTAAHCLTV